MSYKIEEHGAFLVIGIDARTSNSGTAIGELWGRFLSEDLSQKIPNRSDAETSVTVYTEYESDHTGEYRAIVGCPVTTLDEIPDGMVGYEVPDGSFACYRSEGIPPQSTVRIWQEIWKEEGYERAYIADVDIYNDQSFDPEEPWSVTRVGVGGSS